MSLVEVVVATLVVGIMFVAAIGMVGASRKGEFILDERARGALLGEALMGEILEQAYEDPQEPPGGFGVESADVSAGKRALFDDVDDYHNWTASPPQEKSGTAIAWAADYATSVVVQWVKTSDPTQSNAGDTGIKRIVVTVKRSDREVAVLTAWRTDAWRDPGGLGK
jgi:Tfp pilus assembly protein PilV